MVRDVQGQRQLTLGETPDVVGNDHPVICPYGVFEASDGPFNMAAATDDMFAKLCTLIGLPDLVFDERYINNTARMKNRDELKTILNFKFIGFLVKFNFDWKFINKSPYFTFNTSNTVFVQVNSKPIG